MSVRALLVGPTGHGGEGVYMTSLQAHPPDGIEYVAAGDFHTGAPGAPCQVVHEVRSTGSCTGSTVPDMGFRALRLRDRFDLVHVHGHPVRLAQVGDTPLVMSEGSSAAVYLGEYLGWDDARLTRGFRRARRLYRIAGVVDRLLALERVRVAYVFSEWARAVNLRWGADPGKLRVIPPGFRDPGTVDRASRDDFTFVFVGGDFERKGGFELLEAVDELRRERPDIRVLLVGPDPALRNPDRLVHSWVGAARRARGLARLAELEREGVARRVAGTDRASVEDALRLGDAFVMPTHAEGFGFANVEAMSFGLPVVTSTAGPASEIVDEGRTGLLVAPGDVEALREAMSRLAGDRDQARRMGAAAREAFQERFTLERFRSALGALYRRALEG